MNAEIVIRRAESQADYRACQAAQRAAWGITDDSYILPIATMVGAQLHGGLVLGAFLPDGRAAGLSFAFLGRVEGRLCLYSQLTGVIPGFQDQGLGRRLKAEQREIARAEGVGCIAWAFDPLQAGNARFNLDALGATASRYVIDMYGPRTDALNQNTPTDRLIVVWETEPSERPPLSPSIIDHSPMFVSGGAVDLAVSASLGSAGRVLIEVPPDIQRVRAEEPERADRWLQAVRAGFLEAFGAGYRAVGFVRTPNTAERRGFYVLDREGANGEAIHAR